MMRPIKLGRLLALCAAFVVPTSLGAAYVQAERLASSPTSMVITKYSQLLLTDTAGSAGRRILASPRAGSFTYPWYAWSPDGKYLLVVRVAAPPSSAWSVLILNAHGTILQRVPDAQASSGFYPNWAIDADRVAYLSGGAAGSRTSTVRWADPWGTSHVLFSFPQQIGCGGGVVDPAGIAYLQQTADGGMMFPLQWSTKQHSALMWIGSGTSVIDTRTGLVRHLGASRQQMGDTVLSPSGHMAAAMQVCGKIGCASRIVTIDPVTLRVTRNIGAGELPAWSADGQTLYFVRRVKTSLLTFEDSTGNSVPSDVYRTSIWRVDADGQGLTPLVNEDAYGFGFLNVAQDGRALVFSRVDNATLLWQHRLNNGRFNSSLVKRYGPRVSVQQFSQDGGLVTLAMDSGLPSIQP